MLSIREYLNIQNIFIRKKVIILMFIIGTWNILKSQEVSTQDWPKEDQRTFESAFENYVSLTSNHADDMS